MKPDQQIIFHPFRLDPINQRLARGERMIPLRPKTFAVLQYLLERPGQLVGKDELLDAVWPETSVSDTVLKVCIREIREALGDDPKAPRFIETAHRSGYRFIGAVKTNNLPIQLTSFIGREREMAEVRHLLADARLLTLTGVGGSGKTRLAIEIAGDSANDFADGVWWVDLVSLSDPMLVPQAIATALGVREQPGRALTLTLTDYLRPRKLLLLLDNCEHLVAACATLAHTLLQSCPHLKILATSREALGITGELTWSVPPLSLPRPDDPVSDLMQSEAIRLFAERASAVLPPATPALENAPAIAQVCHRLDGIPLAIELAAARVKVLTVEQIAARLDDCFRLLIGGNRAELPRHQTLRATIDWSYDLLSENERILLHRLSVFAGGFTLQAAEVVCAGESIEEAEVLDLLSHLIDKSLVIVAQREPGAEARYRLLETVRQYGRDKLRASAETAISQRRQADFFLALAEAVEPRINTSERALWLARLENEHGNLRAALQYAIELGEAETGLRLCGALFWFWLHHGNWSEGRAWIREALALPGAEGRTKTRARALCGAGLLAWTSGDHAAARPQLEESVAIWREVGDKAGLAHTLHFLAVELLGQGDQPALVRSLAEESVAIFRQEADRFGLAVSLASLGVVAMGQEDYQAAYTFLEESVAICREIKDNWALSLPLRNLGIVAFRQGDYDRAATLIKESLGVLRELKEKWFVSRSVESLAAIVALQGDYERAARLFGAGEALRGAIGASVLPFYRADYDRGLAAVRAGLDEHRLNAAWAEGRAMTFEQAFAYALIQPTRPGDDGPSQESIVTEPQSILAKQHHT